MFLISLIFVWTAAGDLMGLVESRYYDNGLIFYDSNTKQMFLPPTLSVSRGRSLSQLPYSSKGSIWSTFGRPCSCRGLICGCCTGMKINQYAFDEKMCANFTFVPDKEIARLDVFLNNRNFAKYGISASNPAPLCIPVMMPIPMAMCIQLSNIGLEGNNFNVCMDFVVRLQSADLMEMHFQCMRMGADGLQYLDKEGKPVFPSDSQKASKADEDYDDEAENDYDSNEEANKTELEYEMSDNELSSETEDLQNHALLLSNGYTNIESNEAEEAKSSSSIEQSITDNYVRIYS